jgi:hypothetical protein
MTMQSRSAACVAAVLLLGGAIACQRQPPSAVVITDAAQRLNGVERFAGETRVRTGQRDTPVRVDIRNWSLGGGLTLDELPLPVKGLMIVQLRGGRVTTVIGGAARPRREGEFWTVQPGDRMGLRTADDSATLQTIVIVQP